MARPSEDIEYDVVLLKGRRRVMQISVLGIDIGKNSCSVVGVDDRSAVVVRRTMRRQTLIGFVEMLPTCAIAMEANCAAHHLGRFFIARGHEVRLMSPEYGKRRYHRTLGT